MQNPQLKGGKRKKLKKEKKVKSDNRKPAKHGISEKRTDNQNRGKTQAPGAKNKTFSNAKPLHNRLNGCAY